MPVIVGPEEASSIKRNMQWLPFLLIAIVLVAAYPQPALYVLAVCIVLVALRVKLARARRKAWIRHCRKLTRQLRR